MDGGGEFVSHEFQDYCNKHGIKRYLTALCSHKRNGVVERWKRTLAKMTRNILKHLSAPNYLWRESARCAMKQKKPNVEVFREESCGVSVTFIICLRNFRSDGSQNPRVIREIMINQEEEESNDNGDEEQEWSQSQRSTRVSVRPAYMNDCVHITETECERYFVVVNEEPWKRVRNPHYIKRRRKRIFLLHLCT